MVAKIRKLGKKGSAASATGKEVGEACPTVIGVVPVAGGQPADNQDEVAANDATSRLEDTPGQLPALWGGQNGVEGAGRSPGARGENVEQPRVAAGRLTPAVFAASDVVARVYPGPRGQTSGAWEVSAVSQAPDALGGTLAVRR